jgi:hypothetical protein
MAKRNMTSAVETASELENQLYFETVKIVFDTATYRITNAPWDVVYDGETYQSFGQLISFSDVEENATLEIAKLNITVSGIGYYADGSAPINDFLSLKYTNGDVTINRIYWNDTGNVGGFELFRGFINSANIAHSVDDTTTVGIDCSSQWADFARESGRYTNSDSQQHITAFASDLGFEYSPEVQKEITWK